MAVYPGELINWIPLQFFDDAGNPLVSGTLETYQAGTVTPLATYTDANLSVANPTTITLDLTGRAPNPIFLQATGYKFITKDSNGVTIQTIDLVENVGQVFATTLGNVLAGGAKNESSGYSVLTTDYLVTMSSTGGANPCVVNLPAASTAVNPVFIKNLGTIALAVTPNGSDTIDGINAAYTVTAASSPQFPSIMLLPDHVSAWYIVASHKL